MILFISEFFSFLYLEIISKEIFHLWNPLFEPDIFLRLAWYIPFLLGLIRGGIISILGNVEDF